MATTTILYHHLFFLFCLLSTTTTTTTTITTSSSSEEDLLLTFKSSITDPSSSLKSWSPSSPLCNWTGITCSQLTPQTPTIFFSLDLHSLNLSGEISPSLCQLPSLSHLNLAHNLFNTPIPLHLSSCSSLLSLNLTNNLLWGTLPAQISLLSSLTVLDLSRNHIEGQIPEALGSLHSLQVLNLGSNLLSGTLHPPIFKSLTELVLLDLSQNPSMASLLPPEVGKLSKLRWVHMQMSGFYGQIPETFLGLDQLEVLDLSQNNLTGKIPLKFGLGLGKLVYLDLSQNKLSGSFPAEVCTGKRLVELALYENSFTGSLPKSIEQCSSLERFQVQGNGFGGDFPPGLWSLPKIRIIRAENNRFSGTIPEPTAVPSSLEQVQFDNNNFSGKIPQGLGRIQTLYRFSASRNGFYGNLPDDFCDSPVMSIINVSYNSLSGEIPELRNCTKLVSLSLADNSFTGNIPSSLGDLPVLTYIDLSNNNLTGEIPLDLQNLKLALFNVSFNRLTGAVPLPLIAGLPASFLQGNPGLCGPGLPNTCDDGGQKGQRSHSSRAVIGVIAIAFAIGFIVLALGSFAVYRLYQRASSSNGCKLVLFYPLRVTEEELIMALEVKNIIGRGPHGNVYSVRLPNGEVVAVKRISNSQNKSLGAVKTEIRTLAKARHKNLNKLLGFCYLESTLLVVHEYHQRGSLGEVLLRPNVLLEWGVRLRIAMGTARGLAYLHKDYVPRLLHQNLKSNNVLLDEDFEPKMAGFGLDRVVGDVPYQSSSMASGLDPSCYIAPEYGYSKRATEQMDVYSFGVVLLELITGRQAEQQPQSRESLDVVKWVRRKINVTNGSFQVLDPKVSNSSQQEMLGALEVALRCTSVLPEKRPMMDEVVRLLDTLYSIANHPKFYTGELPISSDL